MTELDNVLKNLSITKHLYPGIFATALGQLDHYFSVIGTETEYDPVAGLWKMDYENNKKIFMIDESEIPYDEFEVNKQRKLSKITEEEARWVSIFGEVPDVFKDILERELKIVNKEFTIQDEKYFFDSQSIADEFILHLNELNLNSNKKEIRTMYPISGYSHIYRMSATDNEIFVRMALNLYKAWKIVLDYLVSNGLYLTPDEVEKFGGASYYNSLEYINVCITDVNAIIQKLEFNHD